MEWQDRLLMVLTLIIVILTLCLSHLTYTAHASSLAQESVKASIAYLRRVMDQFHDRFPVYDDVSSAGNHFHAWAKIPDKDAAVSCNGSNTTAPHSGATAIRCEFQVISNFGGFYFLNGVLKTGDMSPQPNFGTEPNAGINLSGATTLTFWVRGERGGEKVAFFMGGVGRDAQTGLPVMPFPDSTPRHPAFGSPSLTLTTQWKKITIDLTGLNLSYILGGFAWVAAAQENPQGVAFFLDDIQYELSPVRRAQRLEEPRFLLSFTTLPLQPDPFDNNPNDDIDLVLRNTAYTYDNALALLAFLADGSPDSRRRARLIGDAFGYASQHDRIFNDGRLRSDYAAGDIALPPGWMPNGRVGTVPIPGFYDEKQQKFFEVGQESIDIGNNAWSMIALLALYRQTHEPAYLRTARTLGEFIHTFRNDTGQYQGFQGGINDPESSTPSRRIFASVEHNLDIFAAFTIMFYLTQEAQWRDDAQHARQFVEAMWDASRDCYLAGTHNPSTRNTLLGQLPEDVQSWSVLALPDALQQHPQLLRCAEQNHRTTHDGFTGYDFNEDKDVVWFEGTGHLAVAYAVAGQSSMADALRQELRHAQHSAPFGDGEGIAAACHDGGSTGFGFALFRRLHIGATSWHVFAQLGFNPYYQTTLSLTLTLTGCNPCKPGGRFIVQAHVTNPSADAVVVEVKVGVRMPDGTPVNLLDRHLTVTLPAGLNITIPSLFEATIPSALPPGTWFVEGRLLEPELGKTFSQDLQSFVVP